MDVSQPLKKECNNLTMEAIEQLLSGINYGAANGLFNCGVGIFIIDHLASFFVFILIKSLVQKFPSQTIKVSEYNTPEYKLPSHSIFPLL